MRTVIFCENFREQIEENVELCKKILSKYRKSSYKFKDF